MIGMHIGIDEAGKGPVIGSMFAAAVAVPDATALPSQVADSKQLTATTREQVATDLRENPAIHIGTAEITPDTIDEPTTDMNTLTLRAHTEALSQVIDTAEQVTVIADAPDPNADRYARRLRQRCPALQDLQATHQADEQYPVVGAASIIAKVRRDAHIETLAAEYGDLGSGYPSDPTTRTFLTEYLKDHGTFPPCVRTSWQTCRDLAAAADQSQLDSF